MVLGCKSQLRGLSIGFLVLVLIPAVVFAATFDITDFFTAPIEISETEVFTFDVNVSVDETLIGYSSTVNSFVTPSIVLYFTLDPDTGLVTIDLPRFFIGSQMSRTYRAGTGIPFTFLAINKSNEDDTVSRSFTIIVNNANEPPWFDFVSYPNSLNGQSNLNQTFTNFRTGTPISAPIQRTLIENTTYLFNVSFFDLDPEFEGWNDLTVSWYLDNILISGSEPGGDDTVVRDVSAQCTHNVSLGEGNSECYFYFGFQSSGNKTLHVEASDKASPPEVRNITWELQVVNVNTAPYFTSNTTIPGSIGTYLGAPLISIEEGQSVTFDVTYTDDDKDNPFGPFELYDLTSFFRSNGVLLANSTNNESAQFIFETDRNTVTGGLDYDLFYISIEVTDTDLSDFLYFWVNVSNVEEPPDINALLHNAQSVTSGGMVTVNEGDTSNIRIEFSDVDANLDTVIFGIDGIFEIEDTSFTSSGFLEESVAWDFTSAGVYNVTVFINDTTPETADTTAWFLINVSQNTAPVITSFDITNSTGGTTFYEGDQIRVLVTYADDQNNANRFSSFIEINGTTYDFYSGNSFFAWSQTEAEARRSLSFQSRGFYNISAQIFDDGGLFSDLVFNDTIFVNPVEVPPEFVTIRFNNKTESPVTYPYTVPFETHGTITANEGDLFSLRVETNDLNGVNTIDTIIVYNNSEILGQVSGSNILLRDNWFLDFNKAGIHNISVFVNDTTGLFTTTWFLLDVANNTAPEITQFATWNEAGVQSLIFEENSTMFINFTYFDTFDNIDTFSIEVDGEPVSNLQQDSFVISGEYFFPFLSAKDNYNVSIFINDTEGLYARDYVLVNVTLTEVPPEITLITITEANGTVHTIDTEGQIVSVEESNGMVGLNNITVFFSATDLNDNLNESSAQISFNGIDYVGSFNQTFYLDFDSQGEYVINITIFDEAGNRNQNLRYFILEVIDNIPPVVNAISILNSSDGSFLAENKTIFFSMDATDENNNLEYCQLFFSSTPFVNQTMFDCDSTYAIFLGFGTQGFYNVTAVAIDTEGLFHNLTETFYIEKTNRSPTITEFRIGNISVLSGSPSLQFYEANPITFFVRATDPDSDLSYIQILVDGTLVEPTCNISASGSESTLSCSWTPGPFENGIRTISAQAFDVAGLSATRNYDILIQENVPPILDNFTITRNGISNTSFIEGDTMNVSFDIIDVNNNVDTFYIDINFSSGQTRWFSTNLSYIFSFDARGTYNVSIFVNDTFGEFATNYSIITVEPFNFHPEIDEVLITELNGTQHIVEENDIITIKQNYLKNTNVLDMIVTASDLNGFETIETYNFSITGPFAYEFEQFSASNEFTWDIDYTMVGDFLVTITVTDETFLSNTTFFTISILNNTPPSIDFNTITNQDEITVFHENDTLTFNMSVSDIDNNIDTYYISIDGTIVSQGSLAQGGFVTYSRYFNFTSRGLYTVLFFVNDTAGMNNTIEQTILINPTEVPPNIYDVAIEVNNINVGYSMGNNISMAETDLLRVEYLVNDVNEDLDTYEILRDGVLVQSGDLFEDQEVVHIWQTTFSDGGIRNVTFVAFDESGNSSTYTFFINISENLAPEIIELAAYNQDGFIDNISNFAQEGETITINVTAFDDDNDFDNAEIVQLFIDGIQVDLNSSGPSRFLTISYDLFLEYTTTNTSKTYNISAVVEDTEGLLGFASFNLTVFHTPVPPVIETLEISINNGAWNEISSGDLVIINETNSLDFRLIGFDINGNSTLRNVSFTLVDDSLHIVNQYEIPYVSNMFTFNTNYSSSGVYNLSAALFDMDGLFNETFFIIEVINNEAPVFTQLDVFNQNTVNCMTSECVEGDTITINVTIIDDFSPIDNISIFLNNSLVAICEGAYNCSYSTFFNFTSRGTWNFTVFAYDDEPLVNRSELLFTIGPTEVAPEIDTIIINSTLLQQEWVLTEDNFSCTGGVWSNRDCMYIGVPFSFSETDTIRISFNATDVNEDSLYRSRLRLLGFDQNSFEYQQIAFSPLGVYNHAFFLDSDYFEDYGTDVMQLNSFVFDTPSGPTLKVDFTINFTIINNEAPVIDDILIVNSTGGTSYFEGDLLNISFDYSDINNNVDVVWFTINTSSEIIVYNNTGIIPLNLSSFGTYELCAFARDTEPLTTSECEIFVINPVNFDPEITRVEVFNGTYFEINEFDTVSIHEGTFFGLNITAFDLNGNETIVYNISRNGTKEPSVLGDSSNIWWYIDFDQEGFFEILINLTTDRPEEETTFVFYLDIINNTAPYITQYNFTSNSTNQSERNFVEGNNLYSFFTFEDDQNNIDTFYIELESPFRTIRNFTTAFNYTFPFENDGQEIPYNITFFVNDTENLVAEIRHSFVVLPQPTPPEIFNVTLVISNGTTLYPQVNDTISIFENQNATITFNVRDVNNNEDVIYIFNGTSQIFDFSADVTTDFNTVLQGTYRDFNITIFANDTTALVTYYNFTVRVLNNTAPTILQTQTSILGNLNQEGTAYLDDQTITFRLLDFIDIENNARLINISLFRTDVSGGPVLITSLQETDVSVPKDLSYTYAVGERGSYRVRFYVEDQEGLYGELNRSFTVTGINAPPFIENMSVESTFFGSFEPESLETITLQEGDSISIDFDAYDVDAQNVENPNDIDDQTFRVRIRNVTSGDVAFVTYNHKPATWNILFSQAGIYRVFLEVDDTFNPPARGSDSFYIEVLENFPPEVSSFTTSNISSGQKNIFNEGETIFFNFSFTTPNPYNNYDSYILYQNGTPIASESLSPGFSEIHRSFSKTYNFSSRGTYNYTIELIDAAGLRDQSTQFITVNPVEVAPMITQIEIQNSSDTNWRIISAESLQTTRENSNFRVRVSAFDVNEDNILSYSVLYNDTPFNVIAGDNTFEWEIGWFDEGLWNITINVSDNTGLYTVQWFELFVIDNTPPSIVSYNITNSSGVGIPDATFFEDDTIRLFFNYEDIENNVVLRQITFNNQVYNTNDTTVYVPFLSAGVYNYTFYVQDLQGLQDNVTGNITILPSDRPPIIESAFFTNTTGTYVISDGSELLMHENTNATIIFNASDLNDNIDSYSISFDPSLDDNTIIFSNQTTISLDGFGNNGSYSVTLFVNDTTGLTDTITFTLTVLENTEPFIVSHSFTNSTGGSDLYENDSISIFFAFKDNQSNYDQARIYYDDIALVTSVSSGTGLRTATAFVPLSFGTNGPHTIRFFANDTEGLFVNETYPITVLKTPVAPQITSISVFYDSVLYVLSEGDIVSVGAGRNVFMQFTAEDLNIDETLVGNISIDATPPVEVSNFSYTWNTGYTNAGLRNISLRVVDDEGLFDTSYFYLNVSENSAPVISYFNITNSSGGTDFYEGGLINISYVITDIDQNLDSVRIFYTDSLLGTYSLAERSVFFRIPFTDRGMQNISINATDAAGLSGFDSINITVLPTEVPPEIFSIHVQRNINPNLLITDINETPIIFSTVGESLDFSFTAMDPNGNETLDSYWVHRDGILVNTSNEYSFQYLSPTEITLTFFVNDSTSLIGNASVIIRNGTNSPPQISNLAVVNALNASEDITEDSFINITFDAFDVDGNLHFTQVFLNDDLISSGPVSEYYFGFGTSGIYNVTVRAVDYEGAETNASILFEVLQKDVPPEITSVSVFINNTIVTPSPFSTLYSFEGDLITIGFTAVDPNDDLETQQIFRNGQVIGADSAIWNVNVTAAGLYEILLNATDETALSDTFRFNISIRENLPPEDISLMVSNNTGGSFIRGGDLIHIIANATDPENLPIQYEIFFDGVSLGLGRQKSLVLPELLHGDVNISVLVSDLKHTVLHWTIFTVEKSDQAPVIESIGISSQTIPATVIDASSTFSLEIQEGESLFIEPYVSDFNDNLDIVNISILFNDSTNGWEFYDQNLTSILFNPAQGAIGTYSINVLARDDTNLESFFNFSVQVTENLAPNITGISITNSTGGFILSEGGTLDLDVNFTNVFPNEGSIFVSFNGVPLSITRSGSRVQSSYSIPYTARGDNVLNITIIDQLGARTENISLVSIAPTPVAPDILNVLVTTRNGSSYTPQELESIFVQESDGPNSNYVNITYDIFDLNGIDTITSNILTIDGLEQNSRILGYGSSGNYSVQIHVTDLDGLTTTYEFYLFVIQNQAPLVSVSILNSSLGNESFLQGDPVTINATVFDINRDLDSVSLYINQNLVSFDSVLGNTYLYTLETSVFRDELVNITILAKDYEGLVNISENMIFITERNLPPVIESATITNNFTSFIMEVQDTETIGLNQTINISFDVYDPNNDSMTFRIEVNGITISNNYTAQYFLNSLGLFNITFFANDSVFESSESIFLDVQAPQAPIINSISLWNSTNGTTLVEGDSVQYYVNITDINKDITTMSVLFSKNGSGMFINNSHQFSLTNYSWNISFDQLEGMFELPGFIHPNLSITVRLETSTNLQNSYVTQVFVENEEFAPQIQNAFVGDEPVSQNDLIARYSPSDTITLTFDPVDPDLDGDFVSIRIDNLTYNVSMHSFTIPSNSVGRIFNITYFVNDSLGNTDTLFYRLRVVEREVRTVTTTSPSSPGGSAPPPTPRAPQRTPEVSIGNIPTIRLENLETRRIPLTIFNIGDEDLIDLELEILNGHHNISFTYEIDGEANIPANGSRVVYVTITSLGSIQDGEFEVIARGKSLSGDERIFRDLSKIFINKEDESRDDRETFEVLLPEVVQVLTDNARCLDLMRYVEEADLAASNGDYSVANEILSFAKEACMEQARDFTLVPEGNIFTRQDRTGFIILFSVVLLLAAILVPSIILAHKHTQKKKNVDKDKEEEIEKFLEDMY